MGLLLVAIKYINKIVLLSIALTGSAILLSYEILVYKEFMMKGFRSVYQVELHDVRVL